MPAVPFRCRATRLPFAASILSALPAHPTNTMRTRQLVPARGLLAAALFGSLCAVPFCASNAGAQTNSATPQITQAATNSNLVVLRGNVHPLARPEYDRGPAPASLRMEHMLLVLKRSAQQEASLEELLAEQQDKSSPNYHKWLTPAEFGAQFGPSDSDIQNVESWLRSQGFTVNSVSSGRVVIDFSGSAAQVQGSFHTAIHRYVLPTGAQHWANSTDPEIPATLASVVAGIRSLNNFFPKPQHRAAVRPAFTYPTGCAFFNLTSNNNTNPCFVDLTPADLDTIYNVPPSATGAGQTIAIVSDSDVSATDLQQFRSMFSLPAMTAVGPTSSPTGCPTNAPCFVQFVPPGSGDPGIQCPEAGQSYSPPSPGCTVNTNGDESEAALDVEWAGAPAPSANIWLVSSVDTSTNFGGDLSATYVVNCPAANSTTCPVAVPASVLNTSYGACEMELGTSGNQFYNSTWQQAAAEGITVLAATGDSGSPGCDFFDPTSALPQPAEGGLAVSGVASTPYDVAVGGTDFNQLSNTSQFWRATNSGTGESAIGYIPETTWNDSCTNSTAFPGSAIQNCNNPNLDGSGSGDYNYIWTEGGSGGASSCTNSSSTATTLSQAIASCADPYPKPSWQQGNGVPNDGVRDIPDVSLFASNGFMFSAYIVCEADTPPASGQPGQGGVACSLSSPPSSTSPQAGFEEFGGTSVSVQIFGGIVTLMDQAAGGNKQGNVNPILYSLANQSGNTCTSEANPPSSCVFYDVQSGTITQPCDISFPGMTKSPNCTGSGSDQIGILELNGTDAYNAGPGYDLATGLGTVNVGNLIGQWPKTADFILSSSDPSVTIPSSSSSGTITISITSVNGFSGTIDFSSASCSGLPSGFTCTFPASASLAAGQTITETVSIQPSAPGAVSPASRGFWNGDPRSIEIPLECALALATLAFAFSRRRQFRWLAIGVLFVGLGVAAGCGGGGSNSSSPGGNNSGGTGANTTTATMTVASGGTSHTMNFQVTVK
jgi:subtilase family serine protease